jgi:hypothetical protein
MKKSRLIILAFLCLIAFTSCDKKYGDTSINAKNAVPVAQVKSLLADKDSVQVKLEGIVSGVCQKKGCWMQMPISEDENMFVKFKDYGFFVPFDAADKFAIIEGYAYVDTVSVADQIHYAKDAVMSEEEIAEITEPSIEYTFMASGVILRENED